MIPLDVDTRWNSLYLMAETIRANQGAFKLFVRKYKKAAILVPIDTDWKMCEQIERVLAPFYDFTL
jgi:hypothetical protein